MLTVLVYGRNDAAGAQAQRRAALSLNGFAAQLAPERDAILFVDYNGPEDRPTFPEAIADTLTPAARRLIRVIRVRPGFHARIAGPEDPPVLEAVARNIGLRRVDPAHRWVLSTNTDVVPVAAAGTLAALMPDLPEAYHGAPRFEAPALLWERLDRADPEAAARRIANWSAALHLAEIVRHPDPAIAFDAPGDCQLAPLSALRAVRGFDERMRAGWHVDSNLALRLAAHFDAPARALPETIRFFHCEHTREARPKHRAGRAEDDSASFLENPAETAPTDDGWGAPEADFETFPLDAPPAAALAPALAEVIGAPAAAPGEALYGPESFDAVPRDRARALTFVTDRLAALAPEARIGWIGADAEMHAMAARLFRRCGRAAPEAPPPAGTAGASLFDAADLVVADGPPADAPEAARAAWWTLFGDLVAAETRRVEAGRAPRPIIGLNAIHNPVETAFLRHFDCVLAPFPARLRIGTARPRAAESWLGCVSPGEAGARRDDRIESVAGQAGHVFFGPYARPVPGRYRLDVALSERRMVTLSWGGRPLVLELVAGETLLARATFDALDAATLDFEVPAEILREDRPALEARLWTDGRRALSVEAITLTPL